MKLAQVSLFTNITMNDDLESTAIPLPNIFGYAVQVVITGTPTGSLKLQASVDAWKYANDAQPQVPTNWNDITGSEVSISEAGTITYNVGNTFYTFVRLVYTDDSAGASTAVINAVIDMKGA